MPPHVWWGELRMRLMPPLAFAVALVMTLNLWRSNVVPIHPIAPGGSISAQVPVALLSNQALDDSVPLTRKTTPDLPQEGIAANQHDQALAWVTTNRAKAAPSEP